MDRFRSAHTPMDYEYSNGTGPIDESSPFITASRNVNAQNKKRKLGAPPLHAGYLATVQKLERHCEMFWGRN